MIELICSRQSEKDGHAMDVLMEALRKQRVQAHIAGELQRALARAKEQKKGEHAFLCLGYLTTGYPLQEWQVRPTLVVPWFLHLSILPQLPLHVSFPLCMCDVQYCHSPYLQKTTSYYTIPNACTS